MSYRIVRSHSPRLQQELADLLEAVFVTELLDPSAELWLVSPWISNIPVIDNSVGSFRGIEPAWELRRIRLVEVLTELVGRGSRLTIGLRDNEHNAAFLSAITRAIDRTNYPGRLTVSLRPELHEKGILTDRFYLSGSMNITANGVFKLDEAVRVDTDVAAIAAARVHFAERWRASDGSY